MLNENKRNIINETHKKVYIFVNDQVFVMS